MSVEAAGEDRLAPAVWIQSIDDDYASSYLKEGGASVKVVVGSADARQRVRGDLQRLANALGYTFAFVDSANCRVHLVHNLFTALAAQLDWEALAHAFMRRALEEKRYRLPASGNLDIDALAEENDEARELLMRELMSLVSNRVFKDYALSREFRAAATAMCYAVYYRAADVAQEAADARAWFCGELERMSAVRRLGIFRKINRNNARQLLSSTTAWVHAASGTGLIVAVDISRYAAGKQAGTDGNVYTKMASLDLHEVLREFIDGSDDLHSALVVFLTGEEFLTNETLGMRNYDALNLRLTDDVRDRRRPNPFAPMVRLRGAT